MLFEKYIICEEGFGNLYDEKGECTGFQLKVRLPYYLATMMVPNQVLLVPKYLLFQTLHMSNTHSALILPAMFEVFSVFLMRQAFMSVPRSLSESAIIDGASQFRVFGQIILPQIKPTLLTVTLLQFTSSWNDYINPKTYLSRDFMYTIPVGLQKFQMSNGSSYSTIMAGAAVLCSYSAIAAP
ncbi:hypothetical protein B5F36_05760 [Anaerofilum sp. An201]|nr:ABC transporter permease subunit [Anaerofilum sp. An201]OUP04141.1 hypothetical protein B5F36_05760 [Anaerofilum sp. An201]